MSEPDGTESVLLRLERWATDDTRISPDHFACPHYEACNASVNGELMEGDGCCMSYVGPDYGEGFRLAIVGMDHGEFLSATFRAQQEGIQDVYRNNKCDFNPHYAGVVKTAAAILGKAGSCCQDHCLSSCRATNREFCVINRISQPNLVKCIPRIQESRTSRSSWAMKLHCARHLLEELRILRPNMVVFHGIQSRWIVRPEFERTRTDLAAIDECADQYGPVLYHSADLGCHLLFLYHPARGWLDRQWPDVEKWLQHMRQRALIPE